jgi:hypothetical protein
MSEASLGWNKGWTPCEHWKDDGEDRDFVEAGSVKITHGALTLL